MARFAQAQTTAEPGGNRGGGDRALLGLLHSADRLTEQSQLSTGGADHHMRGRGHIGIVPLRGAGQNRHHIGPALGLIVQRAAHIRADAIVRRSILL